VAELPPPKSGFLPTGAGAIAVVIGAVVACLLVSALVVSSMRGFSHFPASARSHEAKTNLKWAFGSERSFFAEKDTFSVVISEIGFLPERGNRYLYAFSSEGELLDPGQPPRGHVGLKPDSSRHPHVDVAALERAIPDALWDDVGISGTCPECSVTIVAAGNIDDDDTIDVWSISTRDRTIDGTPVTAGTPWRHVDDTAK
jgi:type IV pilus assembly protein PilA